MSTSELTQKIKNKGHWVVHIHPNEFKENYLTDRDKLKEIIQKSVIQLRGWDYPHFFDREGMPYNITNGIEKVTDLDQFVEVWRFTKNFNFAHIFMLREEGMDYSNYRNMWSRGDELQNKKLLSVYSTLYSIAEIFEFTKRLYSQRADDLPMVNVEISLEGLKDRELYVDDYTKVPFMSPKVYKDETPWKFTKSFNIADLQTNQKDYILECFLDLMQLFNWQNIPVEAIKNQLNKFLEGRI